MPVRWSAAPHASPCRSGSGLPMPDARLSEIVCAVVVPGRGMATFENLIAFLKGIGAGKLLLPERLEIVP